MFKASIEYQNIVLFHSLDLDKDACDGVMISMDSGDIGPDFRLKLAPGSYVPLGVWVGTDKPIYYKRFVDGEMHGPYWLYWKNNGWLVTVLS